MRAETKRHSITLFDLSWSMCAGDSEFTALCVSWMTMEASPTGTVVAPKESERDASFRVPRSEEPLENFGFTNEF